MSNQNPFDNEIKKNKVPTDVVMLPSKGLLYPNRISKLEIEYLTGSDENIMCSPTLRRENKTYEKIYELKVRNKHELNWNQLLTCDQLFFMLYIRMTNYGTEYETKVYDPYLQKTVDVVFDMSKIIVPYIEHEPNEHNLFEFKLPTSKKTVMFKILTAKEKFNLTDELDAFKSQNIQANEITHRLVNQIVSIDGETDKGKIKNFVEFSPEFKPIDSMKLRKFMNSIEPEVDLEFEFESKKNGKTFKQTLNIDDTFFFPSYGL